MKTIRRIATATVAAALAAGMVGATSAPASATTGTRSIADVLLSDGNRFDHNWKDFDIVTEAALAVLKAKPNSPVSVLTKGDVALTVFAPTDRAFRALAQDVTGKRFHSEKAVFKALVAKFGVNTIETVLLYHVVPGATITAKQALASDGAKLTMAAGGTVTVDVIRKSTIVLRDADRNDLDPVVRVVNINKGNKQIAHGINRVLRPIDI